MESRSRIHYGYVIAILLAIIVILITVNWTKIEGLIEYFSFALTLSSLILAILAIIYSLISNTATSGVLHDISKSAAQVTEASRSIGESNSKLRSVVEKLPSRMDSLDEGMVSTKKLIKEIGDSSRVEQHSSDDGSGAAISSTLSSIQADIFLRLSSVSGLELLLMVVLSERTKTSFSLIELVEKNPLLAVGAEYKWGFFIACVSVGLFDNEDDARNRWTVTNVHETLKNDVDKMLTTAVLVLHQKSVADDDRYDTDDDAMKAKSAASAEWRRERLETRRRIYEYFDQPVPAKIEQPPV